MPLATEIFRLLGAILTIAGMGGFAAMAGYRLYEAPVPDPDAIEISGTLTEAPRVIEWRSGASVYLTVMDQEGKYRVEIPYFYFIQPRSAAESVLKLPSGQRITVKSTRNRRPGTGFIASSISTPELEVLSQEQSQLSRKASDSILCKMLGVVLCIGLASFVVHRIRWARCV